MKNLIKYQVTFIKEYKNCEDSKIIIINNIFISIFIYKEKYLKKIVIILMIS